ncbi:hypothetical protein FOZ62_012482, partial [Perkinsus olseni]
LDHTSVIKIVDLVVPEDLVKFNDFYLVVDEGRDGIIGIVAKNLVKLVFMPFKRAVFELRIVHATYHKRLLVLEMADSDMKKLFRQPIFLTDLHAKTLLYNLLVGIKFLHSAGVYHRDL